MQYTFCRAVILPSDPNDMQLLDCNIAQIWGTNGSLGVWGNTGSCSTMHDVFLGIWNYWLARFEIESINIEFATRGRKWSLFNSAFENRSVARDGVIEIFRAVNHCSSLASYVLKFSAFPL